MEFLRVFIPKIDNVTTFVVKFRLENSTPPLNILRFPFPFSRATKRKERKKKKENKQNAETRNAISRIPPILRLPLCLPREAPSFHACVSRGHEEVKPLFPRQTNK